MRELILSRVISLLQAKGFNVTYFDHVNICFDLIAKNPHMTLIIKAYSNIDAIRPEQGLELKKVADVFNAGVMIIGEKTKVFSLKDGIVYERYGIPAFTANTFRGLLNEKMPIVKYFKGRKIVEMDSEKLREQRKKLGLTLEELAEKTGLTAESIHRYEKGAPASASSAERLEQILKTGLAKGINLFEERANKGSRIYDNEFEDMLLEKVHSLGLNLSVFEHSPFKAYSGPEESFLIQEGRSRQEVEKKAMLLSKSRKALDSESFIIASRFKQKEVEGIPVIGEEELDSMTKKKDLIRLVEERGKKGR